MSAPKISIDQWIALVSVVESGSYAKAAERLHKSQSTLTYAIQQAERLLGVKLFEIRGRKAVLTPTGQLLYRRGKTLVDDAERLERAAGELSKGWETEIRLAVDIIFPTWLLVQCMGAFAAERPETRIELYETVLSGTDDLLLARSVDFVIIPSIPQGFIGDVLMPVHAVCVAAPSHPLQHLGRPATLDDLRRHRHLLIRDPGMQRARSGGWLNEQRWTVSHKATSIHALSLGYGYAWLPDDWIRGELERGELVPVPLREGAERAGTLYLVFADRDATGPGALRLAEIIREKVASECKRTPDPVK
jgi:DNA-binding transcriptional LysR family regulator